MGAQFTLLTSQGDKHQGDYLQLISVNLPVLSRLGPPGKAGHVPPQETDYTIIQFRAPSL